MRPNGRYIYVVPGDGPEHLYFSRMQLSRDQLSELEGLIDDTIEYFCDTNQLSGELAWSVLQCRSTAKLAEMAGELAAA